MNLDEDLLERFKAGESGAYCSWEPDCLVVVLGRGNKAELETYEDRCHEDHIPILRRKGGGGTVVLSPGMLVISLAKEVKQQYWIKEYFQQINDYIIEALQYLGISNLKQQGYSDICLGNRKILGSSMYRSKTFLFYTAALLVSNDLDLIPRYLKHPSKEPKYRKRRSHLEFLTTLVYEYPSISVNIVKEQMDEVFQRRIPELE